jgi:thioesterase domain-containing protein
MDIDALNIDYAAAAAAFEARCALIPLVGHVGASLARLDDSGLILRAPFAPNRNHMNTVFGGSLQTLATLAGWGMTLVLIEDRDSVDIVIRDSHARFRKPVTADFEAFCCMPEKSVVEKFNDLLHKRGRARLELPVVVRQDGVIAAEFSGGFVAIKKVD